MTLLEPEKIENIKENETGTIVSSSVDALPTSNDDGIGDDQSERQNDPNSKKYDFSKKFFCFIFRIVIYII